MEKIDRYNYETYFIDYLDGNLPLGEIDLLLDFLKENPDLADELKGLEKIKFEPSTQNQTSFSHLKKSDYDLPEIFEETCVRAIENELNEPEIELFIKHLSQNKEHLNEYELFKATFSVPDPVIVFENKQHLKKTDKVILSNIWFAAAAVILLGLLLILPDKKQQLETPALQVAEVVASPEIDNTEATKTGNVEKVVLKTKPSSQILIQKAKEDCSEPARLIENVEPMNSLSATVSPVVSNYDEMALVPIETRLTIKPSSNSKYLTPTEFFAGKIDEVKDNGLLGKFVLNTLKKISGDKFEYSTTGKGKVEKLEYNSKFLAFTIPVNDEN